MSSRKTECSHYKSLMAAEAEKAGTMEAVKLILSILDKLKSSASENWRTAWRNFYFPPL